MNGAADLGGMMGFGPVVQEDNEPLFHAPWERRLFALTLAAGATGAWTIDAMRYLRESLPPAEYLSSSYYEIWMKGLSAMLVEKGLASAAELATGEITSPPLPVARVPDGAAIARGLAAGTNYARPAEGTAPFAAGARVRARVFHPAGHTRLPRYARGKIGVVEMVHGMFVFPDTSAHGLGEDPQWLFTVRFSGEELWGPDAEPGTSVSVDAWESYLEPVG
ncbi:nitrile hydratase subunit beta [Aquabacter sp. L1I39]|uniref:nitrile hydratase subunit beta n=1 Tax=Aquabacter sp. L1I39 TaxID=2820278 RepID=UPI001ADD2B79|nr:nitrile hydratase subunit beta [Aquabacter sp. L1I39]QTL02419.1 nitrile hydratase subunit beta [Aquabacter sp. L1I39]